MAKLPDDTRAGDAIAVSGLSALTPLGDKPSALMVALREGRSSVEPADDLGIDAPPRSAGAAPPGVNVSRLRDLDPTTYANVRGMRVYNRATQLGIAAVKLALADAELEEIDGLSLGIVTASTFGHFDTLLEYDRNLITLGIQRTNPTLMPLGLPSAPGAAIALAFGAKAFAITTSDGGASGLSALGLGARLLTGKRARVCVVVAALTLVPELVASAKAAGKLAPPGAFRVLDPRASGTAFGEAAVAFVLERRADVLARGKTPKAVLRGHAAAFAPQRAQRADALARACHNALHAAHAGPAQIALVSACANGEPDLDRAEANALLSVLGESAARTPVTAVRSNLGEMLDAGGLLQALVASEALRGGVAPPIAHFEHAAVPGLRYLTQPTPLDPGCALVTSISDSGACAALVLGRHDH